MYLFVCIYIGCGVCLSVFLSVCLSVCLSGHEFLTILPTMLLEAQLVRTTKLLYELVTIKKDTKPYQCAWVVIVGCSQLGVVA